VAFADDTVGESAQAAVDALADGDVVLLENLRFNAGETAKTEAERAEFADALAGLADAYVSDGFGVVHRKQASVYDVATRLPSAMGGLVVKTEVDVLKRLTEDPERPYAVVLGGAKVADKLAVIDNLLGKADRLLIGGGMPSPSSPPRGTRSARACSTPTTWKPARDYLERARSRRRDGPARRHRRRPSFPPTPRPTWSMPTRIPADAMGLDIGPRSAQLYAEKLADARTVFWNGPMGAFEMAPVRRGDARPWRRRWSRPPPVAR
jgi:phosphoglycerate kinase